MPQSLAARRHRLSPVTRELVPLDSTGTQALSAQAACTVWSQLQGHVQWGLTSFLISTCGI